jgi:hypothetical protein
MSSGSETAEFKAPEADRICQWFSILLKAPGVIKGTAGKDREKLPNRADFLHKVPFTTTELHAIIPPFWEAVAALRRNRCECLEGYHFAAEEIAVECESGNL